MRRLVLLCLGLLLPACEPAPGRPADPFADAVVSFTPGPGAGFGQDRLPDIVLGPPQGRGPSSGSLDVLSLGRGGVIVLRFDDLVAIDGPGADLLVFENPFPGFPETGVVAASEDGETFFEWPCLPKSPDGKYPGCAGVNPVLSSPENGVPATDPAQAGGDAYDLKDLGLQRARYLRIRDSAGNSIYASPAGGFDLDAVAVVNGEPLAAK
jgi:hypothetical protein